VCQPESDGRSCWARAAASRHTHRAGAGIIRRCPTAAETDRVRRILDKQASGYDRQISFFERVLFAGGREWICSQARGKVLELACGTARNLRFYPQDVELTCIELSPEMLAIGQRRAEELSRQADLRVGDVQSLEFADASFDTVTCTLGFCTIPDTRRAAAEAFRVLCPGGQLLMLEHVRSPARPVRAGQRLLEPLAARFEGDHLLREPLDYLPSVGFEIEVVERSKWGIVERLKSRRPA
jgi:ubiquinone/menaquinone biosynthesis C-methylase UbiE